MNPHATNAYKSCATRALLRPAAQPSGKMASMTLPASTPHLHSTFALDQLSEVAKRCTPTQFVMLMAPIFGYDLPPRTYIKLQQALLKGLIVNPAYRISHDAASPADYDNDERAIRINAQAFDQLLQAPERSWELLAIVLHEFGHHLDNVLRQDLAESNPDGSLPARDAQRDEGSRYARGMALFEATHEGVTSIARYTLADADEAEIVVDYLSAMAAVARFQGDDNADSHDQQNHERFEAGSSDDEKDGHFSHETLVKQLETLGFDERELQAIYFGNWLRDYSQLLDPKIVRAADMPKDFPDLLSREALTKIVDVLAVRKFTAIRGSAPANFTAVKEKLGVYLPSEHIDNPKVSNPALKDPRTRDADFEPWVLAGDPLLDVDYESSMKRYIQRSVQGMQGELDYAIKEHRSDEGLQLLGAALHVLEDYFAHSNFVELSLIKLGHNVLPWTSKTDCKWQLPLVTGTFGGADVIASLAYPLAKIIAPVKAWGFKPIVKGHRSDSDQMLLILLGEHPDPRLLEAYETYLKLRDLWSQIPGHTYIEFFRWAAMLPLQVLKNAYGTIFQGVLKLVGNSIDDAQIHLGADPHTNGSTDPSHSQLAKDHAEHPFHSLAAELAKVAITEVAKAMIERWNGATDVDPSQVAAAYFVHPQDSQWQDEIVAVWARQNPEGIKRGASKSEMDEIRNRVHEAARLSFQRFGEESLKSWEYLFSYFQEQFGITLPEQPGGIKNIDDLLKIVNTV